MSSAHVMCSSKNASVSSLSWRRSCRASARRRALCLNVLGTGVMGGWDDCEGGGGSAAKAGFVA